VTTSRADRRARLWEASTGRLISELVIGGGTCKPCFSPDGRMLALLGERETKLFRVTGSAAFRPVCMLHEPVADLAVHPDGRSFATYAPWGLRGWDLGAVALWPLKEGVADQPLARWVSEGAVLDGYAALALGADYTAVRVAEIHGKRKAQSAALDGPALATLHEGPARFTALAVGPDGRTWATMEERLLVWSREGRPLPGWRNEYGEALTGRYLVSASIKCWPGCTNWAWGTACR
jgi:hypothetical protein